MKQGERLAREGKIEEAIALYQEAQKLKPDIDLNPNTEAIDKDPKTVAQELAAPTKVKEGVKLAREGKIEEAISLYQEAQKLKPDIDLNPNTEAIDKDPKAVAQELAASTKVKEGFRLAREGKIEEAIALYQEAQKLKLDIDLNPGTRVIDKDPKAVAQQLAAPTKVKEGVKLAREGKIEEAIALYQEAQKLKLDIDLNPDTKAIDKDPKAVAQQLAASTKVQEGAWLAREGKIEEAIALYQEAQKLDPSLKISATSWNALCWNGSLYDYAAEVMFSCEKAVALAPEDGGIRDSRGLARALTGNTQGAIEDFQAFVDWTDNNKKRLQRQRWIDALRAGENPFTEEEIKSLCGYNCREKN